MARILIIEDNPANMMLMSYLLYNAGHVVLEALDGQKGLHLAKEGPPDLVLCDLQLPGMDGYEVAQRLQLDPALVTVPRVAVTAFAMVGDRDKAIAAGFNGYISKPIDPEHFVRQIEAYLPAVGS